MHQDGKSRPGRQSGAALKACINNGGANYTLSLEPRKPAISTADGGWFRDAFERLLQLEDVVLMTRSGDVFLEAARFDRSAPLLPQLLRRLKEMRRREVVGPGGLRP